MKRVGITGQNGFVGAYLFNKLSLLKEEFILVPFDKSNFESDIALERWLQECDVIVHLAAMNRHPDQQFIHDVNVGLVQKILNALGRINKRPHILFSSSTQEERENLYGISKRVGRTLFEHWAKANQAVFTGLVIPNVFGPYGKPFYNSVIATFCHQLCHGGEPKIDQDSYLRLIYVDELADIFINAIREARHQPILRVEATKETYVSEILSQLYYFKTTYFDQGTIPEFSDKYSLNLFNTFRSYIDLNSYYPRILKAHLDSRGQFVEMVKLEQGGQVSFSTTVPSITRGNHFHTRKIERFVVIKGKALIQLRKYGTDEVLNFKLDGTSPSYVDMPTWYTHNITNIGNDELYTVFWINELFDSADPDTYFEQV